MVGLAYNSDNLRCICNAYLVTFIIRYILTIRQMSDKFQFIEQLPFSATALFSLLLAWYNRENGVGG